MFSIENMSGTLIGCILGIFALVSLVALVFICMGRDDTDGNKVDGGGKANRQRQYRHRPTYLTQTQIDKYIPHQRELERIIERLTSYVASYYEDDDLKGEFKTAFDVGNGGWLARLNGYVRGRTIDTRKATEKEIQAALRQYRRNLYTVLRLLRYSFSADTQPIPMQVLKVLVRDPDLCEFKVSELENAAVVIYDALANEEAWTNEAPPNEEEADDE